VQAEHRSGSIHEQPIRFPVDVLAVQALLSVQPHSRHLPVIALWAWTLT
jgi:hypothetical protein